MAYWWQQEEIPEYVEGKTDYTNRQKELMADDWLKKDTKRELCRTCGEKGEETGKIRWEDELDKNKKPVLDEEGKKVQIGRPQLQCPKRHKWYTGEGKARGIAGDNPILFEEHLRSRQKREIYVTVGVPDPSIESGIYNRVHKDGRKVNTKEQRSKHGASFYR